MFLATRSNVRAVFKYSWLSIIGSAINLLELLHGTRLQMALPFGDAIKIAFKPTSPLRETKLTSSTVLRRTPFHRSVDLVLRLTTLNSNLLGAPAARRYVEDTMTAAIAPLIKESQMAWLRSSTPHA
jgi:hypothetical protein